MNTVFHPESLPTKTAKLVADFQVKSPGFLNDFYLSGGTALSLQIGHRQSEDLDFFSKKPFDPQNIQQNLLLYGNLSQTELNKNTLNTFLNDVKLQFLEYPYELLEPTLAWSSLQLSSVIDIACTKLQTISMRGSKKDFIDLYFLLKTHSLTELFDFSEKKYNQVDYNKAHILKSLLYFDDAEQQPMPKMLLDVAWPEVKKRIVEVTKGFEFK